MLFPFFHIRLSIIRLCKWIIGLVVVAILIISVMQYRYFSSNATTLLELKEDYRVYSMALKKVFHQKMKEANKDQRSLDQKKKGIESCSTDIVSSLDQSNDDGNEEPSCMILVNRDDEYLRSKALLYAQNYHLEQAVSVLFEGKQVPQRVAKAIKKRKKRSRARFEAIPKGHDVVQVPEVGIEKDFEFSWPLERSQFWLSSLFGPRRIKGRGWRFHYGIDMAAIKGTPVKAAAPGIVVQSYWNDGYGNSIIIAHNRKYKTRYAHLQHRHAKVGQKVSRGEVIGTVGDTGLVVARRGRSPAHLHFEVYRFDKHVNPLSVLA